jgi:hypothetical protein
MHNKITQRPEATNEETWQIIDQFIQDERACDEGAEREVTQDMYLMREDPSVHLTAAIVERVIRAPEQEEVVKVVLPHLCRCSWCRSTLHETLTLCGTERGHLAHTLLDEADTWARWEAAGRHATSEARRFLHEHGGKIVYARDGVIWEEWPDGTEHRVGETVNLEATC